MKRVRKNQNLKTGQNVSFEVYTDGSLTSVDAEVVCDSGELVTVYCFHPLYPEAGRQLKCFTKKQLFVK